MSKYKFLKNAEGKGGVRYREHKTRKHGAIPDRYYFIRYQKDGKQIEEKLGWSSDKWTPTKCFDILAEIKNNISTGKGPRSFAEMRELAIAEKEAERKKAAEEKSRTFKSFFDDIYFPDAKTRWKPSTAEKAEIHVRIWIHPVTQDTPFKELGLIHANRIKANLDKAGRSPRLKQYVFRTFAMIWDAAVDHGYTKERCPTKAKSFRLPKIDNERQRYLTKEEEEVLFEIVRAKNVQVYQMAMVTLDAGLRFIEVANLKWDCVNISDGTFLVMNTKGKKDRYVPMTDRLIAMFKSMSRPGLTGLVFPNSYGQVQEQIPSAFKRSVKEAKLNENVTDRKMSASYHTLRHTFASRLVQSGVDLYQVQRLMGHSTPTMTARYSKLADSNLRGAIKIMERNNNKLETRENFKQSKNGIVIPFKKVYPE